MGGSIIEDRVLFQKNSADTWHVDVIVDVVVVVNGIGNVNGALRPFESRSQ